MQSAPPPKKKAGDNSSDPIYTNPIKNLQKFSEE